MIFLRSALFNVVFFLSTFVMTLYAALLRFVAPDRILPVVMAWARVELAAARVLCGIRFAVLGRENLPSGPALIASQHQSAFDTLVWFLLVNRCSYVVKRELARIPIFGSLMRPAGMILVDRSAGAAAVRGLVRDGRRAAAEGRQIVIFPEGTRAIPGQHLPIHPGFVALASGTGLPVIPVLTDSGRYWGRRAFRKRPGLIHIEILPPLPPGMPKAALIERLQKAYRSADVVDNSVGTLSAQLAKDRNAEA
jgi:1-acyl-sn-glycerol-3-phosphate acyltransferase